MNEVATKNGSEAIAAETQTALVAAKVEAEIKARYALAIARPRSNLELEQNLLKECERPSFAANALYAVPRSGKFIVGASIRLAETAARLARNIALSSDIIFEDSQRRIIKIQVCDIEANIVYSQDVTVQKTMERKYLKKDDKGKILDDVLSVRLNSDGKEVYTLGAPETELLNKQNANISKALRNQILRLIPADILESAVNKCKQVQSNETAKDPADAKKKLLKAFDEVGITASELSDYLGHAVDTIKPDEMVDLVALGKAIKEGEVKWSDIYSKKEKPAEKDKAVDAVKEAKDKVAEKLKNKEALV